MAAGPKPWPISWRECPPGWGRRVAAFADARAALDGADAMIIATTADQDTHRRH